MKVYVTRPSMPAISEYVDEISDLWESHWLTNMGEKHEKLKIQLNKFFGSEEVELVTNGHLGLEVALMSLGIGPGDEVITTPFTFVSTTHAIARIGAKPVFADIKADDFTLDPEEVNKLITDKTKAILPVHVYGNPCDVKEFKEIANEHNLKLIYDAAHAFGVEYDGHGIGTFGHCSVFSFHATKVFNTIEGGGISINSPELGERIRKIKNFGIEDAEHVTTLGLNAKLNEFCAAMGLCNLRHFEEEVNKRRRISHFYKEGLEGIQGLRLNQARKGTKENYAYFPVLIDEETFGLSREKVCEAFAKEGVYLRKYFFPLVSNTSYYAKQKAQSNFALPIANLISRQVVTLPLYSDLSLEDAATIVDLFQKLKK